MSGQELTGMLLAVPSDGGDMTPSSITPGLGGFIAVFLVGVAILLLVVDMNRRVRRVQATNKVEARHEAEREAAEREAAEGRADEGTTADGDTADGEDAGDDGAPEDPSGR